MNITSPLLNGASQLAALPGDSVSSFLRMIGNATGLFDDGPDGGLGILMSALAGAATALAVAIALTVYFRSGYRTSGADLTFATHQPRTRKRTSNPKAPLESRFSSGPLIPTFAKVPAAMECECWNRTTRRDVVKHGLATLLVLSLVAFVAYDMRHAALAYLGINSEKPAVEFEIRMPKAAMPEISDTQIELHTDRVL